MIDYGNLQNNISELPSLDLERYESIFKVYQVEKTSDNFYYYYNILKKVIIPETIDKSLLGSFDLNRDLPWTTLSYKLYGTQFLWWLIFLINKPENIFYAKAGIEVKYILPQYVENVLNSISKQVNL
jgi:hypothetical protein